MSMFEIILVAAVGLAAAGALWWLSHPLCNALRWLSDPDEAQALTTELMTELRPDDVRAAHEELISRP